MRRLVIGVLVLLGVLVVADFGAAALTESAVSRQMRTQLGLADDPEVRINGFPFLVQAVTGEYPSINVDAERIKLGPLQQLGVTAQLNDVTAPLPMLLGSGPKTLEVAAALGTVTVPPTDIQRLLPGVTKLRIEGVDQYALDTLVDNGADAAVGDLDPTRTVRLVATTTLAGSKSEVAVLVSVQVVDGQIQLVPQDVRLGSAADRPLPAPVQAQLRPMYTLRLSPGKLPFDITPTRVGVTPDGKLAISGRIRNLTLGS